MITHSTCRACGGQLEPATVGQQTHPDCLEEIRARFLVAVAAGDSSTADALADALDETPDAPVALLAAALAYARQSWSVFPCVARGKVPATRHGFLDATTDLERIERWWTRHPDHNIGIPTGHSFDVIDVDYADRPDTHDWWERVRDHSDLEIDGLVTTPRGLHAYILPSGASNSSKVGGINGVDYRGIGGYVVTPPSARDDGTYAWLVQPSPRIKNQQ